MAPEPHRSHIKRTADSPRKALVDPVRPTHISQVNDSIRLFCLSIEAKSTGVNLLPGNWLDVYIPISNKPGGFTVASPPACALPLTHPASRAATDGIDQRLQNDPYLELAIQKSPSNRPASWLWQPEKIINEELWVRVGGDFLWPPPHKKAESVKNLLLVAGGMGIKPLMAIVGHLAHKNEWPEKVSLFYGSKVPESGKVEDILFYPRLKGMAQKFSLQIYLGNSCKDVNTGGENVLKRRMTLKDLEKSVCDDNGVVKEGTVCYVCGLRLMTDDFVEGLRGLTGMKEEDVMCEKWW